MPHFDILLFDRGTSTATVQTAVTERLPSLQTRVSRKKRRFYSIFPYRASLIARYYSKSTKLLDATFFGNEFKLLAGKHEAVDHDVNNRDVICSFSDYEKNSNAHGIINCGTFEGDMIMDDEFTADFLTLDCEYRKLSTTVNLDICVRLFYTLIEVNQKDYVRLFRS